MDTQNGPLFLKNLAYYVRSHEKGLAAAAPPQRHSVNRSPLSPQQQLRQPQPQYHSQTQQQNQSPRHARSLSTYTITAGPDRRPSVSSPASPQGYQPTVSASTSTSSLATALHLPSLRLGPPRPQASRLFLTPNQLYYLLSRFEELGVAVGPLNIRLENIHAESAGSNYVSFIQQSTRPELKPRASDADSIHSVSSVRSVMSSMTAMWSNLSIGFNSSEKAEKRRQAEMEDIRYLYSAFTKIPYVKIGEDHRAPRIADYEEFPFDSAVPLHCFKNMSTLEVVDLDFRSLYGWDRVADQVRSLTLKKASIDDVNDLLTNIVLDDVDKRRRRSSKNPPSPISTSQATTPLGSRQSELARSYPSLDLLASSATDHRRHSVVPALGGVSDLPTLGASARRAMRDQRRVSSRSPSRPMTASSTIQSRYGGSNSSNSGPVRTSSGSSASSICSRSRTRRSSSTNLLLITSFPSSKWQFLRHLCLAENDLTTISAQALAPVASTLQHLDLSSNSFTEVPEALSTLSSLRILSLANNKIETLKGLSKHPLPAIELLSLRANRITSLVGIEKLLSLERLDVRENLLTDPSEMARLTGMPGVAEVFVKKNPFAQNFHNHRVTIFNLFRQAPGYTADILIDAAGPTSQEKRQLVERLHEVEAVPVIRPPFDDDPQAGEQSQAEGAAQETVATTSGDGSTVSDGVAVEPETVTAAAPATGDLVLGPEPRTPPSASPPTLEEGPGSPSTPISQRRRSARRHVVDLSQSFGSPISRSSLEASPPAIEQPVASSKKKVSSLDGEADSTTTLAPAATITSTAHKRPILPALKPVTGFSSRGETSFETNTGAYVLSTPYSPQRSPSQYVPAIPRSATTLGASSDMSSGNSSSSIISSPVLAQLSDMAVTNEHYRRKIESLKRDYGKNWLGAMGGVTQEQWTSMTTQAPVQPPVHRSAFISSSNSSQAHPHSPAHYRSLSASSRSVLAFDSGFAEGSISPRTSPFLISPLPPTPLPAALTHS